MTLVIALVLSLAMGLSLGLLGGGASILTVPILVHAFGLAPKEAIATSLVVVGTTSAAALVPHLVARRVRLRAGLALGASSMVAAYVAGHLARFVPESVLLVGFAALMLVTALAMLRGRPTGREPRERSVSLARRDRLEERGRLASGAVLGIGLVLGTATGLFGAGGGFLAVPALVIFGGLPMAEAAATSLLVITMNSVAGLLGSLGHVSIAWPLAATVSACASPGASHRQSYDARSPGSSR